MWTANLWKNHFTGNHEANNWISCQGMKNHGLVIVEELAPSEMEKGPTRTFSARRAENVGALATLGNFGPTSLEKKKDFG
jgi:hypothetical protein